MKESIDADFLGVGGKTKPVQVLKEKTITQNEFYNLSKAGHSAEAGLNFQGVNVEQLTSFMTQICRNRLYKVDEYSLVLMFSVVS